MSDVLVTERRGAVVVARLNRPEARNALDPELINALGEWVLEVEGDVDVRAAVLTGTGDRSFCAGMDLRSFAASGGLKLGQDDATKAFLRLLAGDVTIPLVGAANASALAGGFELLLACDLVVAASEAKFGLPEVKRGLFAAGNGTSLGTRIPMAIALELTLTGDPIDAARALELGLVNAVVEAAEVVSTAVDYAERIAANGPLALVATKELVRRQVADPGNVKDRLAHWQGVVFSSEDAKEGATAFVEKRSPVWRGR